MFSAVAGLSGPIISQTGLVSWLDSGIPASYPGTGTTWTDLTGKGNNCVFVNTPTFSTTNGGQFDFNGSTHYGNFTAIGGNFWTGSWTIQMWVKWDIINNDRCIFSQGTATTNNGLHFITRSNAGTGNQPRFLFGMFFNDEASGVIANTSTYYFVTYTYNSSTYEKQMYFGDTLDTPYSSTQNNYLSTTNNGVIGRLGWNTFNSNYFDGLLSQFYVYNRVLTAEEVKYNYRITRQRYGA
jgi:hypothetical protein